MKKEELERYRNLILDGLDWEEWEKNHLNFLIELVEIHKLKGFKAFQGLEERIQKLRDLLKEIDNPNKDNEYWKKITFSQIDDIAKELKRKEDLGFTIRSNIKGTIWYWNPLKTGDN